MSQAREAKGRRGSTAPYWDPRVRPYLKRQAELLFSALRPDLEERKLERETDRSNPASPKRGAGGGRRARGAAAAARGVERGEGVRSGGAGRRSRERRRGKRWQGRAG